MAKKKPCTIVFNSPLTGHSYQPIKCESMAAAARLACERKEPYRIYVGKRIVKTGFPK